MTTDKTTVGVYNDYSRSFIITVEELRNNQGPVYTAKDYCDWRKSTNLERFVYDPFSGDKIDWKRVRNLLSDKSTT